MNLFAGLPTGNWWSCTRQDGADDACLPGILLHSSTWHTWFAQPCSLGWCPSAVSPSSWKFSDKWCSPKWFNLLRQHSLIHYSKNIRAFGAPNSLCSSITESKHIKAVKEPWRRSSRFEALSQMLLTNQRLGKLAASRVNFAERRMLQGTCLSVAWDEIFCMYSPFYSNDLLN